jgi:hypothetical protein
MSESSEQQREPDQSGGENRGVEEDVRSTGDTETRQSSSATRESGRLQQIRARPCSGGSSGSGA